MIEYNHFYILFPVASFGVSEIGQPITEPPIIGQPSTGLPTIAGEKLLE